ncbi:hypothetical protein BJ165DRAFT_1447548 [Panaeolus papilionaceus]|nr:hypothetical protein BJ165DRAFT_1447548 [Panaeolus papilionaceus]
MLNDCAIVIIVGRTGAGKSSFIEKLASKTAGGPQGIAKSKLDAGTLHVVPYRVDHQMLNLGTDRPLIIVDTPGLSDKRISEMIIVRMIQKWLRQRWRILFYFLSCIQLPLHFSGAKRVDRLFYMDSISDKKMTRSQATSLEIFKALCGEQAAHRTVILTTMWDQLWNDDLVAQGNHHHSLLAETYFSDFLSCGCRMEKFENTLESVIANLQKLCLPPLDDCITHSPFLLEHVGDLKDTDVGERAFELLKERYDKLYDRLRFVEADIENSSGNNPLELDHILRKEMAELMQDLKAIGDEAMNFSPDYTQFRNRVYNVLDDMERSERPTSPDSSYSRISRQSRMGFRHTLEDWLSTLTRLSRGKSMIYQIPVASTSLPNIHEFGGAKKGLVHKLTLL